MVDPKIVTGRQNCREERTGETKRYLDEKHQRMVRTHLSWMCKNIYSWRSTIADPLLVNGFLCTLEACLVNLELEENWGL